MYYICVIIFHQKYFCSTEVSLKGGGSLSIVNTTHSLPKKELKRVWFSTSGIVDILMKKGTFQKTCTLGYSTQQIPWKFRATKLYMWLWVKCRKRDFVFYYCTFSVHFGCFCPGFCHLCFSFSFALSTSPPPRVSVPSALTDIKRSSYCPSPILNNFLSICPYQCV